MHTITFSLLVIEHPTNFPAGSRKFALVHEKDERGWWLPGGGIDDGETFLQGGLREAEEEAGVSSFVGPVRLIRVEQTPGRMRWILYARAATDKLKDKADKESRGAQWVTMRETELIANGQLSVPHCWLRGTEPSVFFEYLDECLAPSAFPATFSLDMVDFVSSPGALKLGKRAAYLQEREIRLVIGTKREGGEQVFACTEGKRLPRGVVDARAPYLLEQANQFCTSLGIAPKNIRGIVGLISHQRADASALFAVVYYVSNAPPSLSQLVYLPATEFADAFERSCVNRALAGEIAPTHLVMHSEGDSF